MIAMLTVNTAAYALRVEITEDRLTVEAQNVPLQDLLGRFSAFGIRVRMDKSINPKVDASFTDIEIQKGVDRILGPLNHAYL